MLDKEAKVLIVEALGTTFSIWGLPHTTTAHHRTDMVTLTLTNRFGTYHFDIAIGPDNAIQIFHAMDLIYAGQYNEENTVPIFSAISYVLYP